MLDLLSHVGQIVSSGKSLETVLFATVNLVKTMLDVERCSILILDADGLYLRMGAASSIPIEEWDSISVRVGEGVCGRVASTGRPVLVENIGESEFASDATPKRYSTSSFICAPLVVKGQIAGVLNVNNRSDAVPFDRNDLDLMIAIAGFIGLAIDNARLLSSSEDLRTHLQNVVESLQTAVLAVNRKREVRLCNGRLLQLFGVEAKEAVENRKLAYVLPGQLIDVVSPMLNESLEFGVCSRVEIEFNAPGNEKVPLEVYASPLMDAQGHVDGVLFCLNDVSVRREIDELRRLDGLKSNFLAMVSHELRTPLTAIKGSVHLLANSTVPEDVEQHAGLMKIVANNTDRLMMLVNNLLDVLHLDTNTLSIAKRTEQLGEIVGGAVKPYEQAAAAKGITLESNLAELVADVDRDRYQQAIGYLLDNAVKFTPRGGRIKVELGARNGMARVVVRDTGCGISEEMRHKIFTRFYQSEHPLTRTAGGTGIGLYIARALVELHDGRITVSSKGGEGAEFVLEVPLAGYLADGI